MIVLAMLTGFNKIGSLERGRLRAKQFCVFVYISECVCVCGAPERETVQERVFLPKHSVSYFVHSVSVCVHHVQYCTVCVSHVSEAALSSTNGLSVQTKKM